MNKEPMGMYSPARLTQINLDCPKGFLGRRWGHPIPRNPWLDPTDPRGERLLHEDYQDDHQHSRNSLKSGKRPPAPRPVSCLPLRRKEKSSVLSCADSHLGRQSSDDSGPPRLACVGQNCGGDRRGRSVTTDTATKKGRGSSVNNGKATKIGSSSSNCGSGGVTNNCGSGGGSGVPNNCGSGGGGGGGVTNSNRNNVMAGRRLQQLINVSALITDDNALPQPTTTTWKTKTRRRKPPTPTMQGMRGDASEDVGGAGATPVATFYSYLDHREMDMKAAAQQYQNSEGAIDPPNYKPPIIKLRHQPQEKERRWLSNIPVTSRVPPHLCKVRAKAPPFVENQRPPRYDDSSLLSKATVIRSSCNLWGAILKRRDPKHRPSKSTTSVRRARKAASGDRMPVMVLGEQEITKEDTLGKEQDENLHTAADKSGEQPLRTHPAVSLPNEEEGEKGTTILREDRERSLEEEDRNDVFGNAGVEAFLRANDRKDKRHGDDDNAQYHRTTTDTFDTDVALRRAINSYQNRQSRAQQAKQRFTQKIVGKGISVRVCPRHESPPEIFYPPYDPPSGREARTKDTPRSVAAAQKTAESKQNNRKRPENHREACETSCVFWKSLIGEEEKEENVGKMGDTRKEEEENRNRNVSTLGVFPCSKGTDTMPSKVQTLTVAGLTQDVAPPEAVQNCHGKGYEILRKLLRGKFRENVNIYLANNEQNPDFSPVEITVVRLPSRSLARSFLDASFSDTTATKRRLGGARTEEPVVRGILPAHRNLLMRLHVFMSGNCVYQVSSHCQWPPLSHLLESASLASAPNVSGTMGDITGKINAGRPIPGCRNRYSSTFGVLGGNVPKQASGPSAGCGRALPTGGKRSAVAKHEVLHESARKTIFRQICEGLSHLHEHGILHGDLNCSNILVTDTLQVKLAGYGPFCLHTPWESSQGESCNPPIADPYDVYIPPEIMARRSYRGWARSSDIWCLGMTLLHMTLGEVSQQVNCAVRLHRSKKFKALCLANMSYQMGLLLESLLQVRPQDRPGIADVSTHAWFSDGTDLASAISRVTQAQPALRTDGRTFPLPKRIRQAFATLECSAYTDTTLEKTGLAAVDKREHFTTQWTNNDDDDDDTHDEDNDDDDDEEEAGEDGFYMEETVSSGQSKGQGMSVESWSPERTEDDCRSEDLEEDPSFDGVEDYPRSDGKEVEPRAEITSKECQSA